MKIGDRVGYVGPTIERPWLPRGTEGVITDLMPGTPYPVICDFPVRDGEDWPMRTRDLEHIR